jgi:penicillin-binding protein 2
VPIENPEHWRQILEAMLHVTATRRGTAYGANRDANYTVAGKTGTAQVFSVAQDAEYDKDEIAFKLHDHALFIAFAPAEDPQIAISVVVEHGGSGGSVAAPIARKVMDAFFDAG